MKTREIFDIASTLFLVGVAVFLVGMRLTEQRVEGPKDIRDWVDVNAAGLRIGPVDAEVEITEFLDVQCPFCVEAWHKVAVLLEEYPEEVSLVLHHYPLDELHPQAIPGAIALECASQQRRLRPFLEAVFRGQDALGTKTWLAYAEEAEIADMPSFGACVDLPVDSFPRIAEGLSYKDKYRVTGTPALFVNGEYVSRAQLAETVREALVRGR